jgi:hypothetical protein
MRCSVTALYGREDNKVTEPPNTDIRRLVCKPALFCKFKVGRLSSPGSV